MNERYSRRAAAALGGERGADGRCGRSSSSGARTSADARRRRARRRRPRRAAVPPAARIEGRGIGASARARWSSRRRPSSTRRVSEDGVLQTKEGEQRCVAARRGFVVHDASRGQYARTPRASSVPDCRWRRGGADARLRRRGPTVPRDRPHLGAPRDGAGSCGALLFRRLLPVGGRDRHDRGRRLFGDAVPVKRRGVPDRRAHLRDERTAAICWTPTPHPHPGQALT